jgi:predicted Zn-dependent peptidase
MLDRTISPEFFLVNDINIPEVITIKVAEKYPLFLVKSNNDALTEIIFNFDAGIWVQPKLLVASMTRALLTEGTQNYSAREIANVFDFYGANLSSNIGMHSSSIRLFCLTKHLPSLLPIVNDVINFATFEQKEFDLYQNKYKQQLVIELEEVENIARNQIETLIFGSNHPYGWTAIPSDYDNLNRDLLIQYYENNYTSDRLRIILTTGQVDFCLDLLNKYINLVREKSNILKFDYELKNDKKTLFIPKKDALQSAVRIGWNLFEQTHRDFTDMFILDTILGGYFGSRLMQNIRQIKGYTYSIYSEIISYKYGGSLQIASEVKKQNKNKVVDEIFKEVELLQNELINNDEFSNLKSYMLGELLQQLDGQFAFAHSVQASLVYNLPFDIITKNIERIKNIKPERIMELAQKYLIKENAFVVIVG